MAENPLIKAHKAAARDTDRLGELFARLGNTAHPNSQVLIAYRNANRALRDVMKNGGRVADAREVTGQLKSSVKSSVTRLLQTAAIDGATSANTQLKYYGSQPILELNMSAQVNAAYGVVNTCLQKQETAMVAMLMGGADTGYILGDEGRQGVLRPAEVIATGAFWITALFWDAFSRTVDRGKGKTGFSKQVVAALDARTTETCLLAHGQVVGLDDKFHLIGTPRYADYLDWTPFHALCRSSVVLYMPEYDNGLTERLKESARVVLDDRAKGVWRERHPSDAFE